MRSGRRSWFALVLLGVLSAQLAAAGTVDPGPDLAGPDRQVIADIAGADIIVGVLPAPRLSDPSQFLELDSPSLTYRVRDGAGRASEEPHRWEASARGRAGAVWRYRAGDAEIGQVERDADGSFVISGTEDLREKVLTRYQPAEPLLTKGLSPGEEHTRRMEVLVYDPAEPGEVLHRGSLDVAYRYLGAYRIKTPSGLHDAILTKSVIDGSIGPAHLHDIQYRFFARGVGIVATVEVRDVDAAVVYHSESRIARLLSGVSQQQAECSGIAAVEPELPQSVC